MSQVKIYGLKKSISPIRRPISEAIHQCVVETLKLPADKRFHRFILLDEEDFIFPPSRSDHYLIIEIMMLTGRQIETRKQLIKRLFEEISHRTGISTTDIEVCILESPAANWGFRGMTGDEGSLTYSIDT